MTIKHLASGLGLGLISVLTLLASGCTVPAPQPQTLTIGVLTSATAGDAAASDDAVRGAQLAIDVVNDEYPDLPVPLGPGSGLPGFPGAKLALVSSDTGGNADQAAAQATAMVTERHAVGLVVAGTADVAAAIASQTQRLRVPLIDACSTADYLTELGMEWYFRAGPVDRALTEGAFALLRGTAEPKIVLLTEAGPDSAAATKHLQEMADRTGSRVVAQHEVTGKQSESDTLRTVLADTSPAAVFGWAPTIEGAEAIARAAAWVSGNPPLIGLGPGFRKVIRPAAGAPPMLRAVPWSAELAARSPAAVSVMNLYEKRFGRPMSEIAAAAFTSVIALAAGIDAAGSADPAAIRSALRQTSLPATAMIMPWNGVRFGPDGQNQLAAAVVEAWDTTAFRVVFPAELSTGPVPWIVIGAKK